MIKEQDLHSNTTAQIFNVPIKKVTPEQRAFAKRLNFALVYGMGAARFNEITEEIKNETSSPKRK